MITRASTGVITRASTRDHVIEIIRSVVGTLRDVAGSMRTIQISIGEIIEAMYDELIETYGDRELALVAAQALGDDLLARAAKQDVQRSGSK